MGKYIHIQRSHWRGISSNLVIRKRINNEAMDILLYLMLSQTDNMKMQIPESVPLKGHLDSLKLNKIFRI